MVLLNTEWNVILSLDNFQVYDSMRGHTSLLGRSGGLGAGPGGGVHIHGVDGELHLLASSQYVHQVWPAECLVNICTGVHHIGDSFGGKVDHGCDLTVVQLRDVEERCAAQAVLQEDHLGAPP